MTSEKPFWQTKRLHEMTAQEWESLCDGCGRCCLVKLEDEDTGEIHDTDVSCQLLDCSTCRCTDYANRHDIVDDCIKLDVGKLESCSGCPGHVPTGCCGKASRCSTGIHWFQVIRNRSTRREFR
jgi:uncharacterized cysteine cluster protein YcgN (CxxCxxCC family)